MLDREHRRGGPAGGIDLGVDVLHVLVVCCDCNRPTLDSIQEAGFTVTQVKHTALPKAPKVVSPAIMGSATAPAPAPASPVEHAARQAQ